MRALKMLLFLTLMPYFQGLGARPFTQGDTLTLWYRDAGQSSGYYQGVFLVDTVTQNFYIMSLQVPFPVGPLFGSFRRNLVGTLIDGLPHFFVGDSSLWYLDTTYIDPDLNLTLQLQGGDGFGYSGVALLFGFQGVKLAKAPSSPLGKWTTSSFYTFPDAPIQDIALAPRNPGVPHRNAKLYILQSNSVFIHERPSRASWSLSLVSEDLYVDDHFEQDRPFYDAGTFAADWTLSQGSATEAVVYMEGHPLGGLLAENGARFSKAFSLPVQDLPLSVDLSLGLVSQDAFWFEMLKSGNEAWSVGIIADTVKLRVGQEKALGVLNLSATLREPVKVQLTLNYDETDSSRVLLTVDVLKRGRPIVSAQETLAVNQVMGLDQVRFDVLAGRLFLDRVRVAPYYRLALGDVGTTPDVFVLTEGGTLFRYVVGSGWEVIAQGLVNVKELINSPAVSTLTFWFISQDGALYQVDVPNPNTVHISQISVDPQVAEVRDFEVSETNPDSFLVATDFGVFVSGDGGQSWQDLSSRMAMHDPISWIRDARFLLWEGGDTAIVATYGGYFLTTDRFQSFQEIDRTNFMRTEQIEASHEQIVELARVLEDSTQYTSNGIWQEVQNLVGGLDSDVDGDPRIAVLLADVSHLPAREGGRIPVFDVVDPSLFDPQSEYFDSMECFVLDVNFAEPIDPPHHPSSPIRGQTLPHPVSYAQALQEGAPSDPHALDAVIRALTRLVVFSHRKDEESWIVEAVASVVERTLRIGHPPDAPDTLLNSIGQIPVAFRVDLWTSAYFGTADDPPLLRKFLYVFFKFLLGEYNLTLQDFVNATAVTGKELVVQLTGGMSFSDVYMNFLKKVARRQISLLPRISLESFQTPYSSRGTDVTVDQIVPYGFVFVRVDNNYEFTGTETLRVDSLRFAIRVWDTLQVYGVVFRGVGDQVSLDPTFNLEAVITRDSVLHPNLVLVDPPSGGPVAGDRAFLILARFPEGNRVAGVTITLSDFQKPQTYAGFIQDPLVDTRGFYYLFASEPLFADIPPDMEPLPAEGPWFVGVWKNPYGLFDTLAAHMERVVSGVYYDGVVYRIPVSLLADRMDVTLIGEDRLANPMDTLSDTLTLWSLRPGTSALLTGHGIRLEVPAGAVSHEVKVFVHALDEKSLELMVLPMQTLEGAVRVYQVGSASIHFLQPARLLLEIPPEVRGQEIRVFQYTADGWQEVAARRAHEDRVELITDRLGMFALVADGKGARPTAFSFSLTHPVIKDARKLAFDVAMPEVGDLQVTVFNALGRQIITRAFHLEPGFHRLSLGGKFAPGTYFVRVRTATHRKVDRFVVVP